MCQGFATPEAWDPRYDTEEDLMCRKTVPLTLIAVLALTLLLAPTVDATVVYMTDFPNPGGVMPTGWSALVGSEGTPGWRWDGKDLRFDESGVYGLAHYTGPLSEGSSTALSDFTITTEFRKTNPVVCGIAGRIQDAGSYYHARLYGQTALQIYRFDGGSATQLGSTVTASDTYNQGETWRLSTTFEGPTITARLYNQSNVLVGTAIATDSTYASGSAGLRAQNPNAFESVAIETLTMTPGTLLAYEGFETNAGGSGDAYIADATIRGADKPRTGFTGAWTSAGGFAASTDVYSRTAGLSYGALITTPGSMEAFRNTGTSDQVKYLRRDFDYSFDATDEVWASCLFNFDAMGEANGGSAFVAELADSSTTRGIQLRIEPDGAGPDGTVRVVCAGNSGSDLNLGTVAADETHLLVVRSSPASDGPNQYYDAIDVWVDPVDLTDLGAPDAEGYGVVRYQWPNFGDLLTLDELELRWRPQPAPFSFTFDEFRLGTGSASVLPVIPEPGTLTLLALGGLGLLARRRKRAR